jgi:hypothetical protein
MGLDDVFGDGKSQPGATTAARPVRFVEALEDAREIGPRDSDAGVFYRD